MASSHKTGTKVLQLAAVDVTVKFLLLPLIDRLIQEGHDIHIACSPGPYLQELADRGYKSHPVPIARKISPLSNVKSFWQLCRLMRRERFDIVHVHTPVAAVLGRVAAKIARVPVIIYTAHGFYFHERMPRWKRCVIVWIERWLARCCTDVLFLQSAEDAQTAVQEGITPKRAAIWIGNGVSLQAFERPRNQAARAELGLSREHKVVGFVGRLVQEKGVEELFAAMEQVVQQMPGVKLLVIGDTLSSDRDTRAKKRLWQHIARKSLQNVVTFAGFREDIAELLGLMDVFVLPSHREGMPRTILEAMAVGVPVVATNIRGCREEVVDGVTGLLVPVGDPDGLARAIIRILADKELASRMGKEGRKLVEAEFDETIVLQRQIDAYRELLEQIQTASGP